MGATEERFDARWLPVGHLPKWHLHVEHHPAHSAGPQLRGGKKVGWHITVSPWGALDAMVRVLIDKDACPNLVIGGRPGVKDPIVVQMIPFDEGGRAMQHTFAPETNRANMVQVEICANPGRGGARVADEELEGGDLFALPHLVTPEIMRSLGDVVGGDDFPLCIEAGGHPLLREAFNNGVASWTDATYSALGNLSALIRHRTGAPNRTPRSFRGTGGGDPKRFTPRGFVETAGDVGHSHAPGNTHIDPTPEFDGTKLRRKTALAPNDF